MKTLTPTPNIDAEVNVPEDFVDVRSAVTVEGPVQALYDITEGLKLDKVSRVSPSVDNAVPRFDGVNGDLQSSPVTIDDAGNVSGAEDVSIGGEYVYDPPRSRSRRISVAKGVPARTGTDPSELYFVASNGRWEVVAPSEEQVLLVPMELPHGSTVTHINAHVQATFGGLTGAFVRTDGTSFSVIASASGTSDIDLPGLSVTIDNVSYVYYFRYTIAASANTRLIYDELQVFFLDTGPRNF